MKSDKLIIAHRGASYLLPENTLPAFQKAIDLGADMIELDVRKTRDDIPIVVHDKDYQGRLIRELTYQEIFNLSQGQIPTFEEVLKLTARKIKLDIELKESGYEQQIGELIQKYLSTGDFFISSFRIKVLMNIKKYFPGFELGIIIGSSPREILKFFCLIFARKFLKNIAFVIINRKLYNFRPLRILLGSSKKIVTWTVDEENEINELLKDPKIFAIATNRPELALTLRRQLV